MAEPLIFIPGLLCDREIFEAQIAALSGTREVRVADHTRSGSIPAIARDILGEAPEAFALAGLSMGGYVAFEILRQARDRVRRLALLDTQAGPDTVDAAQGRRSAVRRVREGDFAAVVEEWLPKLVHPRRREDAQLMGRLKAMAQRLGPDVFIRQQKACLDRADSRGDLDSIAVPTLVLAGRQDALTPVSVQEEMAARIEPGRCILIEDCGHLSAFEQPEKVTRALQDWLDA